MRVPSIARLVVVPVLFGGLSCGQPAHADSPPSRGQQYIIGLDLSGSRSASAIRDSRGLIEDLVTTKIKNGDQIVFIEMYGGPNDADHQWTGTAPAYRDPKSPGSADRRRLEDFRSVARQMTSMFFDTSRAGKMPNTDVFTTLDRAANYARGSEERHSTLLLLSDMENSTPSLRMERSVPSASWIDTLKAQGRLPDLHGICIVVSGAGTATAHQARIRDFWLAFVAAAGGNLSSANYRSFIPKASELHC